MATSRVQHSRTAYSDWWLLLFQACVLFAFFSANQPWRNYLNLAWVGKSKNLHLTTLCHKSQKPNLFQLLSNGNVQSKPLQMMDRQGRAGVSLNGFDPLKSALEEFQYGLMEVSEEVEDSWNHLLGRMNDRLELIEFGLESAQERVDDVVDHSSAGPALTIMVTTIVLAICIMALFLLLISLQVLRPLKAVRRRQRQQLAQSAVQRAMRQRDDDTDTVAAEEGKSSGVPSSEVKRPMSGYQLEPTANYDFDSEEAVIVDRLAATFEALDVRVRQRSVNRIWSLIPDAGGPQSESAVLMQLSYTLGSAAASTILKTVFPSSASEEQPSSMTGVTVPDRAKAALTMLLQVFTSSEDQRAVTVALCAAASSLPQHRWRFKETVLSTLIRAGADSRALVALLLHDLDDCLGLPWKDVSKAIRSCKELGEEVVSVISEKKRLEQLTLLLYLRNLSEDPNDAKLGQAQELLAANQLTRLLYLRGAQDFRAVLVEIAEVEEMLKNISLVLTGNFEVPPEGRALARCALDLHAPLAHCLGLEDGFRGAHGAHESKSELRREIDEHLSPSLEQRALRLHFPEDYSMIEEWMCEEDELLHRTLSRCIREVRLALNADPDVRGLATFEVKGRVKSVYSLVKKLLRQRGVSRSDLKAEAVKDLLALEVVMHPNPSAELPKNPEWLAEEWRERAACFAALDALQRYALCTVGWWVLPGSTKDYITKSKKSGYRALHITLGTNVSTVLPKASSKAVHEARVETKMPCKLEVHIFSSSMKQKERKGLASHNLYKAFELSTDEVFASLARSTANPISPRYLRAAVFPAERLQLPGEVFSPDYVNFEFERLCASSDSNKDGRLSFGDVQMAQQHVSHRLEDFRRALEQRQANWWVHGVHAPQVATVPTWSWGQYPVHPSPLEKVEMLNRALFVAKDAHKDQVRKSGDPYWTHPLSVADILARMLLPPAGIPPPEVRDKEGHLILEEDARAMWHRVAEGPEDIFAMYLAALLHDTVEDTSVTVLQIEALFGRVVASLVDGVTKASCDTKSRASRSAQDLRKVLARSAQDVRVLIIKFADRLHNMRTLEHMPKDKQRRIAEETQAVYIPLAERLGIHVWKTELEELCCWYTNDALYEEALEHNEKTKVARQRNLRYILQYTRTLLVELIANDTLDISVEEEPVHTQLRRWADHPSPTPPDPLPRIIVLTKDKEICWSCLGLIHSILPPMPGRLKDYISSPKENLYMCLHTTVLMDGAPVQVYIKSLEMAWVADYGVGAFWRHNAELQQTDTGRCLQNALHSTWIHEANASLQHSLLTLEASIEPDQPQPPFSDDDASSLSSSSEGHADLYTLRPLLEQVASVASSFSGNGLDPGRGGMSSKHSSGLEKEGGDGGMLLAALHRAYSEALREKVAVFTPTGRVLYLPRDATPLDFAVWNLGAKKGLRADAAVIDNSEAPLHTKLTEGQTVLVHLREGEQVLPPREWAGLHLRYLRTTRARAALVELRTEMLNEMEAVVEGRAAAEEEFILHSLDLEILDELGDAVLAGIGRGALPVELVSGQLLATRLGMPLGNADQEYIAKANQTTFQPEEHILTFLLIAEARQGLMGEIVASARERGLDFNRLHVEPQSSGFWSVVAEVNTDCALRFGSLMHSLRYRTEPLLLQRLPKELNETGRAAWLQQAPPLLDPALVLNWKQEALALASKWFQENVLVRIT